MNYKANFGFRSGILTVPPIKNDMITSMSRKILTALALVLVALAVFSLPFIRGHW
ncbi:MAG: hypothetical protein R1F54_05080 [Candidatus Zeuxoniibacter abyssi]|nr:MAG: hypothetical protein R1F54_05080 [Candidatus Persebacteraceae bacterium AB1(2)]